MKHPVLYLEKLPGSRLLAFDFAYDAMLGAQSLGIKYKAVDSYESIPGDATNILVGSVEFCRNWLHKHGYSVPKLVDLNSIGIDLKRSCYYAIMSELYMIPKELWVPVFIKPYYEIKAFDGFVASDNNEMLQLFTNGYTGPILVQDIINYVSEYRAYITNNRLIGIKHYLGDPLIFPNPEYIKHCIESCKDVLNLHSYSIDFGIAENGQTYLIEINDGWGIGNYGIPPKDYYLFVRNRWLQITGVRKRMDII